MPVNVEVPGKQGGAEVRMESSCSLTELAQAGQIGTLCLLMLASRTLGRGIEQRSGHTANLLSAQPLGVPWCKLAHPPDI